MIENTNNYGQIVPTIKQIPGINKTECVKTPQIVKSQ